MVPSLGSVIAIMWAEKRVRELKTREHAIVHLVKEFCPKTPCNFLMSSQKGPGIIICDVRVVEELYTTKNKYFDKHFIIH